MSERVASVLVCDDLWVSLNNKFSAHGIYVGDISIPTNPSSVNQLVFLFTLETDITDPFRSLVLQVLFPDAEPNQTTVPISPPPLLSADARRRRWTIKWPFLIQQPILRPGAISVKVIHEKGELTAFAPWIVVLPPKS
jgi:hypothetical protein